MWGSTFADLAKKAREQAEQVNLADLAANAPTTASVAGGLTSGVGGLFNLDAMRSDSQDSQDKKEEEEHDDAAPAAAAEAEAEGEETAVSSPGDGDGGPVWALTGMKTTKTTRTVAASDAVTTVASSTPGDADATDAAAEAAEEAEAGASGAHHDVTSSHVGDDVDVTNAAEQEQIRTEGEILGVDEDASGGGGDGGGADLFAEGEEEEGVAAMLDSFPSFYSDKGEVFRSPPTGDEEVVEMPTKDGEGDGGATDEEDGEDDNDNDEAPPVDVDGAMTSGDGVEGEGYLQDPPSGLCDDGVKAEVVAAEDGWSESTPGTGMGMIGGGGGSTGTDDWDFASPAISFESSVGSKDDGKTPASYSSNDGMREEEANLSIVTTELAHEMDEVDRREQEHQHRREEREGEGGSAEVLVVTDDGPEAPDNDDDDSPGGPKEEVQQPPPSPYGERMEGMQQPRLDHDGTGDDDGDDGDNVSVEDVVVDEGERSSAEEEEGGEADGGSAGPPGRDGDSAVPIALLNEPDDVSSTPPPHVDGAAADDGSADDHDEEGEREDEEPTSATSLSGGAEDDADHHFDVDSAARIGGETTTAASEEGGSASLDEDDEASITGEEEIDVMEGGPAPPEEEVDGRVVVVTNGIEGVVGDDDDNGVHGAPCGEESSPGAGADVDGDRSMIQPSTSIPAVDGDGDVDGSRDEVRGDEDGGEICDEFDGDVGRREHEFVEAVTSEDDGEGGKGKVVPPAEGASSSSTVVPPEANAVVSNLWGSILSQTSTAVQSASTSLSTAAAATTTDTGATEVGKEGSGSKGTSNAAASSISASPFANMNITWAGMDAMRSAATTTAQQHQSSAKEERPESESESKHRPEEDAGGSTPAPPSSSATATTTADDDDGNSNNMHIVQKFVNQIKRLDEDHAREIADLTAKYERELEEVRSSSGVGGGGANDADDNHHHEEEIQMYKKICRQSQDELQGYTQKYDESQRTIDDLTRQLETMRSQLLDKSTEHDRYVEGTELNLRRKDEEVKDQASVIEERTARVASLESDLENVTNEKDDVQKQYDALRQRVKGVATELKERRVECRSLSSKLEAVTKTSEEYKEQIESLQSDLRTAKQSNEDAGSLKTTYVNQIDELKSTVSKLEEDVKREKESAEATLAAYKAKSLRALKSSNARVASANASLSEMEEELGVAREQQRAAQERLENMEGEIDDRLRSYTDKIAKLTEENEELANRLSELEESHLAVSAERDVLAEEKVGLERELDDVRARWEECRFAYEQECETNSKLAGDNSRLEEECRTVRGELTLLREEFEDLSQAKTKADLMTGGGMDSDNGGAAGGATSHEQDGMIQILQEELAEANEAIRGLKEALRGALSQRRQVESQLHLKNAVVEGDGEKMHHRSGHDLPREQVVGDGENVGKKIGHEDDESTCSSAHSVTADFDMIPKPLDQPGYDEDEMLPTADLADASVPADVFSPDSPIVGAQGSAVNGTAGAADDQATPLFYAFEKQAELNTAKEEITRLANMLGDVQSQRMEALETVEDMRRKLEETEARLARQTKLLGVPGEPSSLEIGEGGSASNGEVAAEEGAATANLEYLKHVMLRYMHAKTSNERRSLLPVLAAILCLTTEESQQVLNSIEMSGGLQGMGSALYESVESLASSAATTSARSGGGASGSGGSGGFLGLSSYF